MLFCFAILIHLRGIGSGDSKADSIRPETELLGSVKSLNGYRVQHA